MSEQEGKQIREIVTRLLARREHSVAELYQKLQQRGFDAELYMPIVAKFTRADIQSDLRFAEGFARQSVSKGHGLQRICAALKQRQVADGVIQHALAELEVDWFELARQVFLKKFGLNTEGDWQQQQKYFRYLQYRGFSHEQIRYACRLD